jgi:hypothetical protein
VAALKFGTKTFSGKGNAVLKHLSIVKVCKVKGSLQHAFLPWDGPEFNPKCSKFFRGVLLGIPKKGQKQITYSEAKCVSNQRSLQSWSCRMLSLSCYSGGDHIEFEHE